MGGDRASRPPLKAVNGNLLIWPLCTAACTFMLSESVRGWIVGRLRMISDVMGIRQAGPLAYTLEQKQELMEWEMEAEHENVSLLEPRKSFS